MMMIFDKTADIAEGLSVAIANNTHRSIGYMLTKPKYIKEIAKTVINSRPNKLIKVVWINSRNEIVCRYDCFVKEEDIPKIGEVIYSDFKETYELEKNNRGVDNGN